MIFGWLYAVDTDKRAAQPTLALPTVIIDDASALPPPPASHGRRSMCFPFSEALDMMGTGILHTANIISAFPSHFSYASPASRLSLAAPAPPSRDVSRRYLAPSESLALLCFRVICFQKPCLCMVGFIRHIAVRRNMSFLLRPPWL